MTTTHKILIIVGALLFVAAIWWLVVTVLSFRRLKKKALEAYKGLRVAVEKLYTFTDRAVNELKEYGDTESIAAAKNDAQKQKPKEFEKKAECDAVLRIRLRKFLSECPEEAGAYKDEMASVEAEIFKARKAYNSVVREFNCKRKMFPDRIAGALFRFKPFEFYTADEATEE